jgi:hypothetical protein
MNLSPSPLLSRVHVLKLKRKDGGVTLGLLAGFQSATLWTQQKPVSMAQGKAATVAFAIAVFARGIVLLLIIGAANKVKVDLSGGRLV